MKATKMLVAAEHQAVRRASGFLSAARKRFGRLVSSSRTTETAAQRRYVREAEKTIADAEKIIKQLKTKVAAAKRSLPHAAKRAKKRAKKKVKRATAKTKRTVKKAARKSRNTARKTARRKSRL
ncbi:MAG TPA: hypothetical protein VIJ52_07950 [Pseudolabrys sp.]|nr:hypothetical protein [Pseudolabrys sp.]